MLGMRLKIMGAFFPTDDENIDNYGEYLLDILSGTTLLGISGLHMENYFSNTIVQAQNLFKIGHLIQY